MRGRAPKIGLLAVVLGVACYAALHTAVWVQAPLPSPSTTLGAGGELKFVGTVANPAGIPLAAVVAAALGLMGFARSKRLTTIMMWLLHAVMLGTWGSALLVCLDPTSVYNTPEVVNMIRTPVAELGLATTSAAWGAMTSALIAHLGVLCWHIGRRTSTTEAPKNPAPTQPEELTQRDMWKMLDEGRDPTA